MTSLLEQADDFARADEVDTRKRKETKRSDKVKGKGAWSILDRLSCSQSAKAYSSKQEHFTSLLKFPNEIYVLTKGREILRQPLKM